jgi:Golgi apparatus protein 1
MIALALFVLLAAGEHPCAADADRLCQGVKPGEGRLMRCLEKHEKDLSQACREKRDSFRERVEQFSAACRDDVEKFCDGVVGGHGNVARCLRRNEPNLSASCRAEVQRVQQKVETTRDTALKIQEACRADEQRLCPDVDLGGGKMVHCLEEHQKQLSPPCAKALAGGTR